MKHYIFNLNCLFGMFNIFNLLYSYIFNNSPKIIKNMDSQTQTQTQTQSILFKNEYDNRIILNGEINYSFQMNFLKQYSKFKYSDNIFIEITTNGGDFYTAYMIAQIIQKHSGHITILVPFHILAQGTIIALSADKIILSHIGCIGTISGHIQIQKELMYLDYEEYTNSYLTYKRDKDRRNVCCGIREYFSPSNFFIYYFQRFIRKIKSDKHDLIDNILDKYKNADEIKNILVINTNFSKPLFIKELSGLGLNINIEINLISKLFSYPINDIDKSCETMKNTLTRIKHTNSPMYESSNLNTTSSSPGSISNLISLITRKIDVDTK